MDETPSLPTLVADSGAPLSRLALHAAARSHPGRIRDGNEDSVLFIQLSGLLAGTPALGPELGFFAVADGIGGHDRGEVASCRVLQHLAAAVMDRVFKRLILTDRGVDEAWMERAGLTALAGAGDATLYEGAAAAFDEARRLGLPPRMLWYQFAPYEAYLAVGRHADVLALAEATLGNQGGQNVEETYYYQGLALRAAGDEAGAQRALARAVALNPDSPIGRAAQDGL